MGIRRRLIAGDSDRNEYYIGIEWDIRRHEICQNRKACTMSHALQQWIIIIYTHNMVSTPVSNTLMLSDVSTVGSFWRIVVLFHIRHILPHIFWYGINEEDNSPRIKLQMITAMHVGNWLRVSYISKSVIVLLIITSLDTILWWLNVCWRSPQIGPHQVFYDVDPPIQLRRVWAVTNKLVSYRNRM